MMETLPSPDEESDHARVADDSGTMETEGDTILASSLNPTDVGTISMCLKELTYISGNAQNLIVSIYSCSFCM